MSWAVSYWLPTEKWMPNYWPPYSWQIRDSSYPMQLPTPPNGDYSVWPWWLNPNKSTWPYQPVPWEPKILGAFSARKVMMWSKDPNEYSTLVNPPPFGTIKVKTPSDYSGIWPGMQASFMNIKVHMTPKPWLDISPHPSEWVEEKLKAALQEMSRKRPIKLITPEGSITIKSMR